MVILLDVDGVLADFVGDFLRVANRISGESYAPEDVKEWDLSVLYPEVFRKQIFEAMNEEGFCRYLPKLPGSEEAVKMLRELGKVYAVTAPWVSSKTWCWERTNWLMRHFDFAAEDVLHVTKKHLIQGDVLIDDRDVNVAKWLLANPGIGILWDAPYNRASKAKVPRATSWFEVQRIIFRR